MASAFKEICTCFYLMENTVHPRGPPSPISKSMGFPNFSISLWIRDKSTSPSELCEMLSLPGGSQLCQSNWRNSPCPTESDITSDSLDTLPKDYHGAPMHAGEQLHTILECINSVRLACCMDVSPASFSPWQYMHSSTMLLLKNWIDIRFISAHNGNLRHGSTKPEWCKVITVRTSSEY